MGREDVGAMIQLHVFAEQWGLNPSPFCLKVETYCRLAGIAFETKTGLPVGTPRGKLPVMELEGELVPDSGQIVATLKERIGDTLDTGLSAEQHALGHLLRRTCEESLYFCLVYARWLDAAGWSIVKPAFFGAMPVVVRDAVAAVARRSVRGALHGQGYGRHGKDEIYALGQADLRAVAAILGRQDFAVAGTPSSYDASVYALLANILLTPLENPLKAAALGLPALPAYVARVQARLRSTAA
jgi:glutathione S-transferase